MDVLVLGGGPAGATAAIYAARSGKAVTLVYQDSGALARAERIENFYGFPAPISGPDLFRQGLEQVRSLGVTVKEAQILSLGFGAHGLEAETTQGTLAAPAVVLATGGVSYPATGSTGDGHRMAAEAGHTVTPLQGALVPLQGIIAAGIPCVRLQGLSLRNVSLTVFENDKKIYTDFGELLFTHFGVSGPLVLSASAHLRRWEGEHYTIEIDLKPALDEQKLDARVLRDIGENPNREMGTIAAGLVPHSMAPVVLRRAGLTGSEKANSLTKEQRRALVQVLKHFTLELTGPRPVSEAIVTAGGVKVGEVTPNTMASKRVRGLFFAGEVLDVDGDCGGFNLQWAWSSGHLAGLLL